MKHFIKQSSSLYSVHGKIGIQMNNTVYTSKDEIINFLLKKPSDTKHSPPTQWIIYGILSKYFNCINYTCSLICIVKPKFTCTRINETWFRNLD